MKKQMTRIIKNIFSVIGGVEHGSIHLLLFKHMNQTCQKTIRIADSVIISIHQIITILYFCFYRIVRQEEGIFRRITFAVIEMRTVCMKHDKLFPVPFRQFFFYQFQQFIVGRIVCRIRRVFFYKIKCVGFHPEEIDERMIITLIGKKGRPVTSFAKGCDDSFLIVNGIEVTGGNTGHQHGYAFVGGIGFCQNFRESNDSRLTGQQWICLTFISV